MRIYEEEFTEIIFRCIKLFLVKIEFISDIVPFYLKNL